MKNKQYAHHIENFERQFLENPQQYPINNTQQNLMGYGQADTYTNMFNNNARQNDRIVQSMMVSQVNRLYSRSNTNTSKQDKQVALNSNNKLKKSLQKLLQTESQGQSQSHKLPLLKLLAQWISAYAISIGLFLLSRVVSFPFFQILLIGVLALSFKPVRVVNLFMLLPIPIAIANYNLNLYVLTYPQIVICFVSSYLFPSAKLSQLMPIFSTIVVAIFMFIIVPSIGQALVSIGKGIILYYCFPFLQLLVRMVVCLINMHGVPNPFSRQIGLALLGLWFGMCLTLNVNNVQFWYLIVLGTLDIINNRYQFLFSLIKRIIKKNEVKVYVQADNSGYIAINSFHIVAFVYAVCKLNLNSAKFQYNLTKYLDQSYKPLVIWSFFLIYQIISIARLTKHPQLMIIGYRHNSWKDVLLRSLALTLGLWFFYLGLAIPSEIFTI